MHYLLSARFELLALKSTLNINSKLRLLWQVQIGSNFLRIITPDTAKILPNIISGIKHSVANIQSSVLEEPRYERLY
jgi:hypothetical protein